MSRINSFIRKRVDGVMILLFFFIFSLVLLFVYLQNINTNIKNNENYTIGIVRLHGYNQEIDNTLMRSYRYLDNDKITEITKQFDRELLALQENKINESISPKMKTLLEKVTLQYTLKTELVESFKTLNARITSSVNYLFELQKSVESRENGNPEIEIVLGDILFKVGQVFLGKELEILNIDQDLIRLDPYRSTDEDLDYFYRHSKQMLLDVRRLNRLLQENEILALDNTIRQMSTLLEEESQINKKTEERISLSFLVFALVILMVLLHTYLRVLQKRKEVAYLAYHDTLTALPNRAEFERYIDTLIDNEYIVKKQFIVLFIDLDRFKVINDTLGHDIGDDMLVVLAARIGKILGKKNLLARIGGDEFVAIIENKEDLQSIDAVVAEIISVIREPIHIGEYSLNTSASIGIAQYPGDGHTKSILLKHADSAMYHAKDNGGDTYAFYNEQLSVDIQRRLELEQELVSALKQQEFHLYYQPQYHLKTGRITGVEALVRWESPILGKVSPEEFIPVAEETGLIIALGHFVFRSACQAYMKWKAQGVDIDHISINVSSVELRQPDALMYFKTMIEETGIAAKNIEIELTERYIMEYTTKKLTILDDLRSLGCSISIDDFGTGYSSMSYLKSLTIDTIKIDKSFILGLPDNRRDATVARAIIILSRSLGYEVIAEGVETLAQENVLRSFHCQMGQGYYFAKPMDSEKLIRFYHEKQIF